MAGTFLIAVRISSVAFASLSFKIKNLSDFITSYTLFCFRGPSFRVRAILAETFFSEEVLRWAGTFIFLPNLIIWTSAFSIFPESRSLTDTILAVPESWFYTGTLFSVPNSRRWAETFASSPKSRCLTRTFLSVPDSGRRTLTIITVPESWFFTEALVSFPNTGTHALFALVAEPFIGRFAEVAFCVIFVLEPVVFLVADALSFAVVELIHVHVTAGSDSFDLVRETRSDG